MKRLLLSLALLASGCTMGRPIQQIVVDQNTVLAKSTDEVMLVNLLRAEHNQPMHFALVSQFHGSASLTAGLTLGATFPGGGAPVPVTPQANSSFTETPSFDSSIIDSQAFFQGFLRPIDPAVAGHFLYDGWNSRLLTYLLVRRFDLVAAHDYDACGHVIESDKAKSACATDPAPIIHQGDLVAYLDNDLLEQEVKDGHPGETNPFIDLLDHFQLTAVSDKPAFGTPLVISRFQGGARIQRDRAGEASLPFHKVDAFLGPADSDETACTRIAREGELRGCVTPIPVSRIFTSSEAALADSDADGSTSVPLERTVKGKRVRVNVRLVLTPELRSPESTFFFVGQYLRQTGPNPSRSGPNQFMVWQDWPNSGCPATGATQPMIVATPEKPAHALLSAELDGTRYYIPDSRYACNGTSMKVLTLLEQLFYLQVNSSDKLGLTPTIHVVP